MTSTKPIPKLRGEEKVYFDEAKEGRLVFQECDDCSQRIFYPRTVCTACMSENLTWVTSSGKGEIYSFTTLHIAGHPSFADDVPYTIVLVDLEEGVRVLADLVDCEPDDAQVGMAVEVLFEAMSEDFTVPRFRPRSQ